MHAQVVKEENITRRNSKNDYFKCDFKLVVKGNTYQVLIYFRRMVEDTLKFLMKSIRIDVDEKVNYKNIAVGQTVFVNSL